jgi:hypothetical protein
MAQPDALRDRPAQRVAEQVRAFPAERVHHGYRVVDHVLGGVRLAPAGEERLVRVRRRRRGESRRLAGVALVVARHREPGLGEGRTEFTRPPEPRSGQAHDQQQRLALRVFQAVVGYAHLAVPGVRGGCPADRGP